MRRILALTIALAAVPAIAAEKAPVSAADAIKRSIVQRMGPDADVTVNAVDGCGNELAFREARPAPSAQLGRPIRFTLVSSDGGERIVTATVNVIVPHAIVNEPVLRAHAVEADAVMAVRGPVSGVPVSRLPSVSEIVGTQALRPLVKGEIVQTSFVKLRRAVEPGDTVTVTALVGPIEVSAQFEAIDGGNVGAVIRVRNPESKRFVRGRIRAVGQVEVMYER